MPNVAPYAYKDIVANGIDKSILAQVLSEPFTIDSPDLFPISNIYISGIYLDGGKDQTITIYTSPHNIDAVKLPRVNRINIYINNNTNEGRNEAIKILEAYGYTCELPSENIGSKISTRMSVILMVLLLVLIIMIILSYFIISTSARLNVIDRTYEVGVLKSLGATKSNIYGLFIMESLFIGITTSIISALTIIIAAAAGIAHSITISGIVVFDIRWWHLAVLVAFGTLVTLISCLREAARVSNIRIVDAIRNQS
jgi:ABC-type lipoprotein release transport system permease subunit